LRLAIESLECERQCRIFGAGEVHHVGKTAIRKSDAVHAGIFRVLLDCNEGITTSPMAEEQSTVRSMAPHQSIMTHNGLRLLDRRCRRVRRSFVPFGINPTEVVGDGGVIDAGVADRKFGRRITMDTVS
jgi:hypothetical protein